MGQTFISGSWRASLWSGNAASYLDLHPLGASESYAYAEADGVQVGQTRLDGLDRASLWSGTAASWVDLHPSGAEFSSAVSVHDGQIVGYAILSGFRHAGLWTGTATSFVDLHPAAASESTAYSVYAGQQGGRAVIGGNDHASLWAGTGASWMDLHPLGASESHISGVFDDVQVGWARVGGVMRASLWTGSASTWVDLHALLPSNYSESRARGVWRSGGVTYVAGSAFNNSMGRTEAMLWTGQPGCPTVILQQPQGQIVDVGTAISFQVVVATPPAATYQWKKNGVNILNGGRISGAKTATLSINGAEPSDNGGYSVVVTTGGCSATSDTASLLAVCPSDYNADGFVTGDDFDGFMADFELGLSAADVNHDTFVSGDDFDFFVEHFEAGC